MSSASETVQVSEFGTMPDGTPVHLYTIHDGASSATFTDYGARVVSVRVPNRAGTLDDVVLGFDSLAPYFVDNTYQGAIVGRVGNRIANGAFQLGGQTFRVPRNNGTNALHGGSHGFDIKLWQGKIVDGGVEFTLVSHDGDMGFPGTLSVTVRYTFSGGALRIDYTATTDAPTVVNLTNHAYFNLSGDAAPTILDHQIRIPADLYTPVTPVLIPTGELAPVADTPMDLRQWTRIGDHIDEPFEQLTLASGFDHNWVFGDPGTLKTAAWVTNGDRVLKVETTEPGVQFYAGNFIDGTMPNRSGGRYLRRAGLCLETQHYPDSPNQPEFPSTTLLPGDTLRSTTIYTFSIQA
jgi:aldose 1-epimerase